MTAQFASWVTLVGGARKYMIGSRIAGEAFWRQLVNATDVASSPLGTPTQDSHNAVSIGVDGDGFIHVAGNMHVDPLKYMRSSSAGSLKAWSAPGMIGTEETEVTYPAFVRLLNGDLLFFYRDGGSGNGDLMLNRYTTATQTWTRIAKLIDGKTVSRSPYWSHVAVERATGAHPGRIHIAWTFRNDASGPNTNDDVFYAYSDDDGTTWRKSDATAYTLPITRAAGEMIVSTTTTGSGLMNNWGLEVDPAGYPHMAIHLYDANGFTQINHVYRDDTGWHRSAVTAFTNRMDLADVGGLFVELSRPAVACFSDGTVWIIYHTQWAGLDGLVRAIDVTNPASPTESTIATYTPGTYDGDIVFDTQALYARDEVTFLLGSMRSAGLLTGDGSNITAGTGYLVTARAA